MFALPIIQLIAQLLSFLYWRRVSRVLFSDIDECKSQGICANGQCINYAGGYECSCGPGFEPSSDMRHCIGKCVMKTFNEK